MQNFSRSIRAQPPAVFSSRLPYNFGRKSTGGVRFQKGVAGTNRPETGHGGMDQEKPEVGWDSMSSFGEGYATRSDEEGFGGIYVWNQDVPKKGGKQKVIIHEHSPEFDKQQGCEVKEKEKSRHQKDADP